MREPVQVDAEPGTARELGTDRHDVAFGATAMHVHRFTLRRGPLELGGEGVSLSALLVVVGGVLVVETHLAEEIGAAELALHEFELGLEAVCVEPRDFARMQPDRGQHAPGVTAPQPEDAHRRRRVHRDGHERADSRRRRFFDGGIGVGELIQVAVDVRNLHSASPRRGRGISWRLPRRDRYKRAPPPRRRSLEAGLSRRRRTTPSSAKRGMPPGTLVYTGERTHDKVTLSVFDYDANHVNEIPFDSLESCLARCETPTVTWINVDGLNDVDLIERIGKGFGIHPLALEDVLATQQRPKVEDYDDRIFLV